MQEIDVMNSKFYILLSFRVTDDSHMMTFRLGGTKPYGGGKSVLQTNFVVKGLVNILFPTVVNKQGDFM